MNNPLGHFGGLLAIPAVAAIPTHFPKLASQGVMFGLDKLVEYEVAIFYGLHVLVVAMLVTALIDYKRADDKVPLALMFISTVFFFLSLYVQESESLSYVALAVLMASTVWLWLTPPQRESAGNS
ncbi:MAG: hypothetical protein KAU29_01155 [Gammaproteobacteria bacterium]|nr:hypothetical protein [Gammaproteobacteria bacterium]